MSHDATLRLAPRPFRPELKDTDLRPGIIGQVAGIALVYGVLDDHGTAFGRGCIDRTRRERLPAGKIRLYWDHGDAFETGFYDSDLHIGTVRSLEDVQLPTGDWGVYMVADLLDTPKAHEVKTYLASVLASGGETGLSVGAMTKHLRSEKVRLKGDVVDWFTEFPIREISITSMQSVPDCGILAVRAQRTANAPPAPGDPDFWPYQMRMLNAPKGDPERQAWLRPSSSRLATREERLTALRRSYGPPLASREDRLTALRQSYRAPA